MSDTPSLELDVEPVYCGPGSEGFPRYYPCGCRRMTYDGAIIEHDYHTCFYAKKKGKPEKKKKKRKSPKKKKMLRSSSLKVRLTQPGGPVIKSYASPQKKEQNSSDFVELSPSFNPKVRADPELDARLDHVSDMQFLNPALSGQRSARYSIDSASPTDFGKMPSFRSRSFGDFSDGGASYDENFSVLGTAEEYPLSIQADMNGPLNVSYPSLHKAQQISAMSSPEYYLQNKKNETFMKEMWVTKMKELEMGLAPIRLQAEEATNNHREGVLALEEEYVRQNQDIQRRMEEVERKARIALHEAHLANNIVRLDEQASALLNQTDAMLKMGTWHGQ